MHVRRGIAVVGGTLLATFAVTAPASGASTCSSWLNKRVLDYRPDQYRAGASCSRLDVNKKARAALDISYYPDIYSQWFTALNASYYTGYSDPPIGGAYYEVRDL